MNRKLHVGASLFFSVFALVALSLFVCIGARETFAGLGSGLDSLLRQLTFSKPVPMTPGVHKLPSAFESGDFWGTAFFVSSALALFWLRRTWRLYHPSRRSPWATPTNVRTGLCSNRGPNDSHPNA